MKRTSTNTLIDALQILAAEIQSGDGIANAAIAEAADRLEELLTALQAIVKHQELIGGSLAPGGITWQIATRAINGKQEDSSQ